MESEQTTLYVYLICSFAAGAVPFGWIIAKIWGVSDLRKVGSSNIGATNVVRTAGVIPGALTFLLDFAKGVVPMVYFPQSTIWYGLAAVLGHCYSPFLSFKGGKGVSTTLGAVIAFNPIIGATSIAVYGITLGVLRVSAMGSLFAMLTSLSGTLIFSTGNEPKLAVTIMVLIVLVRHRDNWSQLLKPAATLVFLLLATQNPPLAQASEPLLDFRDKPVPTAAKAPKRIVALMPSIGEAVIELGEGTHLVGVPDYTRLPPALKSVANLGPYNRISVEGVYSLHPDVVLASMDGNEAALVEKLEQLKVRVVTINTQSIEQIARAMEIVAAAVGHPGDKKVQEFRKMLITGKPRKPSSPKTVFVQIGWDPLVTVSHNTFIDELVRRAGGHNIFETELIKYPRPSPEEVIARNPDVIVICKLTDEGDEISRATDFWTRFTNLKAVKSGQIKLVPVDWLTKPGFGLIKGVRELERIL